MQHNILITSAGKRVALTRYFKETLNRFFPEAKVFITDMNPEMALVSYVCDGSFKVPRVTAPEYPEVLLKLCEENNVGMVIATIDTELLLLADLKEEFRKKGIHVMVSDKAIITMCRDKRNTGDFFEKHGVRVPAEVDKYNPTFPLFAKPYDGSLSANLHYIKCAEELTPEILNDPKLLFMEYIDKKVYKEYTVDMYYGKDNRVKCIVPRERIEIRAGEINKGRTAKNEILAFLKEKLGYIEGCVGCICGQLFFHPETYDLVGIEINPRFGGGYPLTYMCGGNFPELLIREYFLGEEVDYFETWKDNMLMLRFDLDDTLCKEIDYLKSAYREIASYAAQMCTGAGVPVQVLEVKAFDAMLEAYHDGRNAFEALNAFLGLEIPVSDLLRMYREHVPQISLDDDTRHALDRLRAEGVLMGIVSDGRELTQWNKVRALGLTEWMDESCIINNSSQENFKPSPCGYERFEEAIHTLIPDAELSFTYVGDNLKKDFIYPNQHGWQAVCLKNDGRNIHPQDFDSASEEALPDKVIGSLKEILSLDI